MPPVRGCGRGSGVAEMGTTGFSIVFMGVAEERFSLGRLLPPVGVARWCVLVGVVSFPLPFVVTRLHGGAACLAILVVSSGKPPYLELDPLH